MTIEKVLSDVRFNLVYGVNVETTNVDGYYIGDLLSFVMGKAKKGQLWLTVQTHPNIVAIASLLELSGVVVVEGAEIPEETVLLAKENGVTLIQAACDAVEVIQALFCLEAV